MEEKIKSHEAGTHKYVHFNPMCTFYNWQFESNTRSFGKWASKTGALNIRFHSLCWVPSSASPSPSASASKSQPAAKNKHWITYSRSLLLPFSYQRTASIIQLPVIMYSVHLIASRVESHWRGDIVKQQMTVTFECLPATGQGSGSS